MKSNIKFLTLCGTLSLLAACEALETDNVSGAGRRTVTVVSENVSTRTSIEYEHSDYSHLVWENGDKVAYLTDWPGETACVAEVTDGSFDATFPSGAGQDNRIYVVYPAGELDGVTFDGFEMTVPEEQVQDTPASSEGILIPMCAVAPIPAEGQNTVKVRYGLPAAVVRFAVTSAEHADEMILSVSMEAEQPLSGTISFAGEAGEMNFKGNSNRVTTTVAGPSMIKDGGYVYLTVMRGIYENVSVSVTTDRNTYVFDGGSFALDDQGAALFKVELSLEDSVQEPQTAYFKEISAGEVFTEDNRYLIARKESDMEYLIVTTMLNNQLSSQSVNATPEGIEALDAIRCNAFRIVPAEGTGYYYLYSEMAASSGEPWIGGPMTDYRDPANFYPEAVEPGPDDTRFLWDISVSEDGYVTIAGVVQPDFSIKFYGYGNCFALCTKYVDSISDIVLLKLQ